jgi:conjugative transfer pilus assembly protein TraH
MRYTRKIIKLCLIICFCSSNSLGYGLRDVYQNLHINNTVPGNYQDGAAGWYSGGSSVIRTKNTGIRPLAMTAPSLKSGCNGIDAFFGSFSVMSGRELVSNVENIGSQAPVYAFHLGLKTYAPQIETILKDLRNLQMELNQFGIGHCKATQAAFAAALPQNTAMYETVCNEMAAGSGADLGQQRKKCRDYSEQKAAVAKAQERDPDLLMDNYNLFVKAATNAGIPKELHNSLMSMTGTIVVKDGVMIPYPSLASDSQSWNTHINGGEGASMYHCNDANCLSITVQNNVAISSETSYAGKAREKLDLLKTKMYSQLEEFSREDKGFLDSLGNSFPIFDHITLEAVSGISILDGSSQVIARYMLLEHLTSVTNDIRKGVMALKQKQINDKYLTAYEKSLMRLLSFASNEWGAVMTDSDRINSRAEKIEKHLMARERG